MRIIIDTFTLQASYMDGMQPFYPIPSLVYEYGVDINETCYKIREIKLCWLWYALSITFRFLKKQSDNVKDWENEQDL